MWDSILQVTQFLQRYRFKASSNFIWLAVDRFFRLGLTFASSILLARFLSISDFGTLSYLMSFVAIFAALGSMGTNGIAVKLMTRNKRSRDSIILSVFLLSLVGYSASGLLMFFAISLSERSSMELLILSAILSSSLLFKIIDALRYWFESQLLSKFVVFPEVLSVIFIFGVKLILIYLNASLIYFVIAFSVELALSAFGVFFVFLRQSSIKFNWHYKKRVTKLIFLRSWPIAISIISIVAYMKIDQIMIGNMLNLESVGIYNAAVVISECIYFLPVIINQTLRPIFFKERLESYSNFLNNLQSLYRFMVMLALMFSFFMMFFGEELIYITYGSAFIGASKILVIHAWAAVFVFLNNATWVWHISENKQKIASTKVLLGLALNIILNYFLIPIYGLEGAAVATIISRMFSAYLSNLLFKDTRQLFFMMTYALFFRSKKWVL